VDSCWWIVVGERFGKKVGTKDVLGRERTDEEEETDRRDKKIEWR
jgi:hypothetical protein